MTDIVDEMAGRVGHNQPPSDLEILRQQLDADPDIQKIVKRKNDLLGAVDRAPLKIETLDQAKRVSELRNYMVACRNAAEQAHKKEKQPWLDGGRVVDAYFLAEIVRVLKDAEEKLEPLERAFKLALAEAERKRLAEEAAARQLEADLRAAAAVTERDIEQAIAVEAEAKSMATAAELAKPSDLGARITNDIGKTSGLRTTWRWRLAVEGDISKVPRECLMVDRKVVQAHIDQRPYKEGPPIPVPGIEFYPEYKA